MEFKRLENETEEELLYRIGQLKDNEGLSWNDIADIMNEILGYAYTESKYRKSFKKLKKFLKSSNVSEDKFNKEVKNKIHEYEKLKDEIYKERCRLSDTNREKNRYLREISRTETIIEEMKYVVKNMKPFNYKKYNYHYGTGYEASLLLSDLHYGLTVDNNVNYYDEDICVDRLNQLRDKTIEVCKVHKVEKLNICILGDDISGLIHFGTIAENNRDVITQCIEVSELLSNFVMQVREKIADVVVYTTIGNHSRVWQGKANGTTKENYERIVAEFLKLRLQPYGITVIDSSKTDYIEAEIAGKTVIMTHGDKDSLTQATANFTKLLRKPIDEIYMGHLHSHREFDDCNTQVIINGSLVSTDDYALSLRRHTNAVQLLRIYGEDVCCYRLKLK